MSGEFEQGWEKSQTLPVKVISKFLKLFLDDGILNHCLARFGTNNTFRHSLLVSETLLYRSFDRKAKSLEICIM